MDSDHTQGSNATITVDSDGKPHIAYEAAYTSNQTAPASPLWYVHPGP